MNKRKFQAPDLNRLLQILILLGFAAFFVLIIMRGTVTKYVHPRMIPFMLFAGGVMVITAAVLSFGLFSGEEKDKPRLSLLFYILPLLTAFAFPAILLDSDTVSSEGFQFYSATATNDSASGEASFKSEQEPLKAADSTNWADSDSILLEDSNFYTGLYEIYENPQAFTGKSITLTGFVYRDDTLAVNEFVPARLVMVCCAADMVTSGFLCRYGNTASLTANSWVTVTGVLYVNEADGSPYIEAKSVVPAEIPVQEYVYPY